jgi:hypothetical protein
LLFTKGFNVEKRDTAQLTADEKKYSDLLLLDLLDPDRKAFWVRYKTDLLGFGIVMLIMFLMIGLLAMVAGYGA